MRKTIFILFSIIFLFGSVPELLAQTATPTATPSNQAVDSFKLFWPVSAGKTQGEKFYSLKILKENLRGSLIFGKPQKAEYKMFLATKRFVEAEKLIKDKKNDQAIKTLVAANNELSEVNSLLVSLKGKSLNKTADEINRKLSNLKLFIPYLSNISEGSLLEELTKSKQLLEELSKNI